MKISVVGSCIVFAFALQMTGCALTTAYVSLDYQPDTNAAKLDRASQVAIHVDVSDVRTQKDRVSSKKNGYGAEMAPYVSKTDVPGLVKDAIQSELRSRGFVLRADSASINVDLHRFYAEARPGFWSGNLAGEVQINVQVVGRDGTILFSKFFEGQQGVPKLQFVSEDDVQKSLNGALHEAVTKLMQDHAFISALFKT